MALRMCDECGIQFDGRGQRTKCNYCRSQQLTQQMGGVEIAIDKRRLELLALQDIPPLEMSGIPTQYHSCLSCQISQWERRKAILQDEIFHYEMMLASMQRQYDRYNPPEEQTD